MRKTVRIFGARALMTVGAVSIGLNAATAAEFDVQIEGEFLAYFGYANSDVDTDANTDFDGVDFKNEGKVAFKPILSLDNGIELGAEIVLEAITDDDQIDESFLFLEASFGRIELGSRVSAGYTMFYGAPDVSLLGTNDGLSGDFIPFDEEAGSVLVGNDTGLGTLNSTFIENGGNDNAQRFTYFSPRFSGFQIGASYARDSNEDDNAQVNLSDDPLNNIFDIGLNFVETVGPVDLAVAGRWGIASDDTSDNNPQIWGVGATVAYEGFSVGGSFSEQNNTALSDGQSFDVGVSYETGPWGFSFAYLRGTNADDEQANGDLAVPLGSDEELQQFVGGVSYGLADGVTVGVFGAYVDFDEDVSDDGTAAGDDVDGFIVGGGIALEF
ncbi:MAG: porin [Pseudomonadota bacterium]